MSTEHTYTPTGPTTPCKLLKGVNVMTPDGAAEALDMWMRGDEVVLRVKRPDGVHVYAIDECMIGGAQ